ncbi:MAG: MGMT family protein [Dehalococcoidales bacterium]|nr:MGMT family protein [Dehalococcoidales bacterium]MDP6737542.1 MGMT family protein [Dehalococcoidales bacterium]
MDREPRRDADLNKRLTPYFTGVQVAFPDKFDLGTATLFQRRVWETTQLIPYGETRSYRWVAERMGQPAAARAVGQALAKNPLPIIIPCHRVVTNNGKLGGFSGGLEMKRYLLRLEQPNPTTSDVQCQPSPPSTLPPPPVLPAADEAQGSNPS